MRFSSIVLITAFFITGLGCEATQSNQELAQIAKPLEPNTAVMLVHGMACPQCAYNIDLQLLKVPGVESVKVDMGKGRVEAKLSPTNPPTREQLAQAIAQTTFTLKKIEMN